MTQERKGKEVEQRQTSQVRKALGVSIDEIDRYFALQKHQDIEKLLGDSALTWFVSFSLDLLPPSENYQPFKSYVLRDTMDFQITIGNKLHPIIVPTYQEITLYKLNAKKCLVVTRLFFPIPSERMPNKAFHKYLVQPFAPCRFDCAWAGFPAKGITAGWTMICTKSMEITSLDQIKSVTDQTKTQMQRDAEDLHLFDEII